MGGGQVHLRARSREVVASEPGLVYGLLGGHPPHRHVEEDLEKGLQLLVAPGVDRPMNGCPSFMIRAGLLVFRGRLSGAMTLANDGSRLNCSIRAPRPKPHPGIMGVLRWPSLSVMEKRLPSPSMTLMDEVSKEPGSRRRGDGASSLTGLPSRSERSRGVLGHSQHVLRVAPGRHVRKGAAFVDQGGSELGILLEYNASGISTTWGSATYL